jgi:hypothetical protein
LTHDSESPLSVFPNPTTGPSTIQFEVQKAGEASVGVFDVAGRHVAELARGAFVPGVYRVSLDAPQDGGAALSSGIYFVRLTGEGVLVNEKIVVIRSD